MARPSPYSPEFREEAVQLALKSSKPIAHVARELNMNPETLRTWVRQYEREHGRRDGRQAGDLVRLLARQRNDFVVAVSADFPVLPLNATDRAPYSLTAPGIRHGLPPAGAVRAGSVVGGCLRGTQRNAGAPADLVRLTAAAAPGVRERRVYRLFTDRRRPSVVWITNMVRHRAADLSSLVGCWTGTADAVRDLRQDFGLLDFEGRSYPGWHHYMTLVAAAHAYRTLLGSPRRFPARELEPVPA